MALYLGNSKRKINLNRLTYRANLSFIKSVINSIKLLSSDGYILKDSNGLYLVAKEDE
jgi:predicted transcriptional regulator